MLLFCRYWVQTLLQDRFGRDSVAANLALNSALVFFFKLRRGGPHVPRVPQNGRGHLRTFKQPHRLSSNGIEFETREDLGCGPGTQSVGLESLYSIVYLFPGNWMCFSKWRTRQVFFICHTGNLIQAISWRQCDNLIASFTKLLFLQKTFYYTSVFQRKQSFLGKSMSCTYEK